MITLKEQQILNEVKNMPIGIIIKNDNLIQELIKGNEESMALMMLAFNLGYYIGIQDTEVAEAALMERKVA